MKSAQHYQKFIEKNFQIVDKYGQTVPFLFNPIQQMANEAMTGEDIYLKARRHGITSLISAKQAVEFLLTENFRGVIVSHETKATQRILDRIAFFLESMKRMMPKEVYANALKLKYASRNELVNEYKNSSIYIGTAGSKSFGRGDQISWLHLSEAAFYDDLSKFLIAVLPAAQGGIVTIETTANGYNDFRDLWIRNKEEPKPFQTHFIGWPENREYQTACPMNFVCTRDEEELKVKYNLNNNQILWRRLEIDRFNGDLDSFAQEYPINDEEAFVVSGNHVWSPSILRSYMNMTKPPVTRVNLYGKDPVHVEERSDGYLRIYKAPSANHYYVVGADVAEGKTKGSDPDYSCAQVFDQTTFEQVAVWHGRIDPDLFGRELDMLGQYYRNALVAVERNSVGLTTLTTLRNLYYPNLYYQEDFGGHVDRVTDELGWMTSRVTKDLIINAATELFREKRIKVYDEETVGEMMGFVRSTTGNASAASGYHDDRVMAMLIGMYMLSKPQLNTHGNPIESDLLDEGGAMIFGRNGEDIEFTDMFNEGEL